MLAKRHRAALGQHSVSYEASPTARISYGHLGHAIAAAAQRHIGDRPAIVITDEFAAMQMALSYHLRVYAFQNLCDVIRFLEGEIDGVNQLVWNTPTYINAIDYARDEYDIALEEARYRNV